MDSTKPVDQQILDEFFRLSKKHHEVAWLFGMIATYGIKPDHLKDFEWAGQSIQIKNRKKPLHPLHPQWVILFELQSKEPRNFLGSWEKTCVNLYRMMALQQISMNITDLLLAYNTRKKCPLYTKQRQTPPAKHLSLV